jgi:hypothetical protein
VHSLKEPVRPPYSPAFLSIVAALGLLAIFILGNAWLHEHFLQDSREQGDVHELDLITDTAGVKSSRMAYYDFESGNAGDTASHLASIGHGGRQSLKMNSRFPFSPGLWIKFKDLKPGDSSWIRARGYVWFNCPPGEVKCSLVATCNHNGVNFKYMFIELEKEGLKAGQWNQVSIDYHVPAEAGPEEVLQAYFWYRGAGEMLVDDIDVERVTMQKNH